MKRRMSERLKRLLDEGRQRSTRFDRIAGVVRFDLSAWGAIVGGVAAAIALIFSLVTWRMDSHDEYRQQSSVLLGKWNSEMNGNTHHYREHYICNVRRGHPIDRTQARRMIQFGAEIDPVLRDRLRKEYEETIWTLNTMEYISQLYLYDVIDREMIDDSERDFMLRTYAALYPFVQEYRRQSNARHPWDPYVRLVQFWNQQGHHSLSRGPRCPVVPFETFISDSARGLKSRRL